MCKGSLTAAQPFRLKAVIKPGSRIGSCWIPNSWKLKLSTHGKLSLLNFVQSIHLVHAKIINFKLLSLKNPLSKGSWTLTAILGKSSVSIYHIPSHCPKVDFHFGEIFKGLSTALNFVTPSQDFSSPRNDTKEASI